MAKQYIKLAIYVLLALALGASILLPLVSPELCAWGPEAMFLLMVAIGYVVGFFVWGAKRALTLFVLSFVVSIIIEIIGIGTGFPFGSFRHTMPGPYLGYAPLASGLGYFPFIAIGWAYADLVIGREGKPHGALFALRLLLASLVGIAVYLKQAR